MFLVQFLESMYIFKEVFTLTLSHKETLMCLFTSNVQLIVYTVHSAALE